MQRNISENLNSQTKVPEIFKFILFIEPLIPILRPPSTPSDTHRPFVFLSNWSVKSLVFIGGGGEYWLGDQLLPGPPLW